MKLRVALITKLGVIKSENFDTKEKADNWILAIMEKEEIKRYRILDKKTGNIIETETGRRDKKNE